MLAGSLSLWGSYVLQFMDAYQLTFTVLVEQAIKAAMLHTLWLCWLLLASGNLHTAFRLGLARQIDEFGQPPTLSDQVLHLLLGSSES